MSVVNSHTRPADNAVRLSGALIGLVVFFVGISLLWGVFQMAKTLFDAPAPDLHLTAPAPTPSTPVSSPTPPATPSTKASPEPTASPAPDVTTTAVSKISNSLLGFTQKWFLLFLMCIAGSFISSRGIELFFRACAAAVHHPPAPKVSVPPTTTP